MENPPRPVPGPGSPPDPTTGIHASESDTTVVNSPPPPVGDGRPPNMPWYMLALMATVITLAIYWWFSQMQRETQLQISATVTAATGATATAGTAADATAVAQVTATAAQAEAQATAIAQATVAAESAVVANATVAAQAGAAEQARATSEAIAAQAAAAAEATRAAPPAATATPVVIVVTATPAPSTPTAAATSAPTATSLPAAEPEVSPAEAPATSGSPATAEPTPAASPAPSLPPSASPSPVTALNGSAASPVPVEIGAATVTVAPGRPVLLQCLGTRVQIAADRDALPPRAILTCRPADIAAVLLPPEPVVDEIAFRLDGSPNDAGALPHPVTLEVSYPVDAVPVADRDRLILGYLEGATWSSVPDQEADLAASRIAATIDRVGVYALYREP